MQKPIRIKNKKLSEEVYKSAREHCTTMELMRYRLPL